jgi:hypothetical protein
MPNPALAFPEPPFRSPVFEEDGKTITRAWLEWYNAVTNYLGGKVPITGSRSGGAAITNLLAALSKLGIISDQTTP